jgi:Bacterial Ig-like domain (group 2)
MRKQTNSSRIFEVTKDGGAALLSCLFAALICCVPQSSAQLQITSPTRGTIVNPGQTLSVTVTSSGNAIFTNVGVIAQNPIGLSDVATSLPAQFSLAIPADIALRSYMLTAMGTTSSGQSVHSETILVDVERPDLPTSLATLLSSFSFQSLGEQVPIILTAKFSDGSVLDITESSYVTYASSDTTIATVNRHGMVTSVGAGSATVTATYTLSGQHVQTAIPVKVRAPKLTATPTALTFGSQR